MKKRVEDILELLRLARHAVPVGSRWAHYKGGLYQVCGHGFDTERGDVNVTYHRVGGRNFDARTESVIRFHRPLSEWTEDRFKEIV